MLPRLSSPALRGFLERESTRPDLGRATRATFAVTIPLLLAAAGALPLSVMFVALVGQNIAMVDVRGSYALRIGLLLAMTAILTGAAGLGAWASHSTLLAIGVVGLVAAAGGVWRHLTPDYGASLSISSMLVVLLSVSAPPADDLIGHHALSALIGGLWGVLLQIVNWPINPQHPLRRTVADSWVAVADLFAALAPGSAERSQHIQECESQLRTTLDHTYRVLALAKPSKLRARLEELNLAAARLATRVVALNTALETALADPASAWLADSLRPVLTSLTNTSRSVAVLLVSRQPAHLAAFEVRLRRLTNLLRAFQLETPARLGDPATAAHLREILRQIEFHLPNIHALLRGTVDRADERAAFSLELFDLQTWTLRPLASALHFHRHVDPALVRFTVRLTVLTMLGVAAFKYWNLPHGFWLPLTMAIVLQPDYGSTRERAAQRVLGTLAGSLAATVLLWPQLPFAVLTAATSATIFAFAYFLKRRYAVAVFFITLFVVLLTEAHEPITLWFTLERIASTLVGGAVALLAALLFWPVWERDRLPPVLAAALDANRDYLQRIAARLSAGGAYDGPVIVAKRQAETANSAVFSSLQRMIADPRNR
ncbi:MAG TPA: FUSC family protein, partial [Opitutus sp.]|nr:FUSC family protein [Opitutus sp.]